MLLRCKNKKKNKKRKKNSLILFRKHKKLPKDMILFSNNSTRSRIEPTTN
jgi:hypothetical protein